MEKIELQKGILLLSEPFLPDPNFKRTVVLLTEHDDEGTVGFVLNRPTELTVNDVLDDFPTFDAQLYVGGPVEQNTLHFLHHEKIAIPGSKEVVPGLRWGGDFESVKAGIANGHISTSDIRFFVGYAGWSAEQLAEEVNGKAWILSQASWEHVLGKTAESLWHNVLFEMGSDYRLLANSPEDPSLN
jgi:putative transcriptional regulator